MFELRFGDNFNTYGQGFAVHSANPYVLRIIKDLDCLIPCGVISTDFSNVRDVVGNGFYKLYLNADYEYTNSRFY